MSSRVYLFFPPRGHVHFIYIIYILYIPIQNKNMLLLSLLLFLTFSVLVANLKKTIYTVANPARGLLSREKRTKEKSGSIPPPTPHPPTLLVRRKIKLNHASHLQALRRSRSVSRPYKDTFGSSTRPMGVASQNSTLPFAITGFPVSLLFSSPGDV